MNVEIVRSSTRKKTVQAKVVNGKIVVYLPLGMHPREEEKIVERMKQNLEKQVLKSKINSDGYLRKRFDDFNAKYFHGSLRVESIEFVTNQERRNGSCTPQNLSIRISHRLLNMPPWVLDYVIMHEMTHLIFPEHSKAFWEKVREYRLTERARGFLIAKGMEEQGADGGEST